MSTIREWPRYKTVKSGSGLAVVDTWKDRKIFSTFGGSRRERHVRVKQMESLSEYHAKRRVARIRRAIVASNVLTHARADRLARYLDAAGIGRWDNWPG